MTDFAKYQALGNDYLVIDPRHSDFTPSPDAVRLLCDRHFGVGADGVLFGPLEQPRPGVPVRLRMFNSDGSVCGRSGNGLRLFALYLAEEDGQPHFTEEEFTVLTESGEVAVRILDLAAGVVQVAMGQPGFAAADVPLLAEDGGAPAGLAVSVPLTVGEERFTVTSLNNGNPHTVVPLPEVDADLARRLGPLIARHQRFPQATNVQFMQVLDRATVRIEVYERGAGYTLASGSSACAAAAVAARLGLVDRRVEVLMPGGSIDISIAEDGGITMTGGAEQVAKGFFAPALAARLRAHGRAPAAAVATDQPAGATV
ncbi:diaminopimelate epimerase [Kitasatospora sp. GAS204B]|uniref:diaminopimelate epimerase n=1 Tax=unclassified Kitasatospora TaxID=2633591 RepID=UPI0024768DC8|nr:diaminopimelate epimerase [Kitasatospora sp. GAS204B]MDH6120036.1 diaminopimelate epimerase [Kitasatospora sp. GAS204B]